MKYIQSFVLWRAFSLLLYMCVGLLLLCSASMYKIGLLQKFCNDKINWRSQNKRNLSGFYAIKPIFRPVHATAFI